MKWKRGNLWKNKKNYICLILKCSRLLSNFILINIILIKIDFKIFNVFWNYSKIKNMNKKNKMKYYIKRIKTKIKKL